MVHPQTAHYLSGWTARNIDLRVAVARRGARGPWWTQQWDWLPFLASHRQEIEIGDLVTIMDDPSVLVVLNTDFEWGGDGTIDVAAITDDGQLTWLGGHHHTDVAWHLPVACIAEVADVARDDVLAALLDEHAAPCSREEIERRAFDRMPVM